jgi:two-component system sensor histidine kinase HydH
MEYAAESMEPSALTQRERELAAIIDAYNGVTERLKLSHEQLSAEVSRLREELSRKNRQLRRRERLAALGELAAGVAHEIRNPLGGISVFASLLRRDLAGQPAPLRLVEKISMGIARLERIVTDILEFGRPAEPVAEPVSLMDLLSEVKELAAGKRSTADIETDVPPALRDCVMLTDAAMLQRALLNLVLNGLEAGEPSGAVVRIRVTQPSDGRIAIEISDNGPGIAPELLDRIFNPFFTTKQTGTGLGLAIVHQTVETLGGSIVAFNRPEGGAAFVLTLPRVLHESGDEQADGTGRSARPQGQRVTAAA